jgi:hypothetical protein
MSASIDVGPTISLVLVNQWLLNYKNNAINGGSVMVGQLASSLQARIGLIKKPAQTQHAVRMAETCQRKSDANPTTHIPLI